jgi:hypothetical protein
MCPWTGPAREEILVEKVAMVSMMNTLQVIVAPGRWEGS